MATTPLAVALCFVIAFGLAAPAASAHPGPVDEEVPPCVVVNTDPSDPSAWAYLDCPDGESSLQGPAS